MKTYRFSVPEQEYFIELPDNADPYLELFDKVLDEGLDFYWEEQSELSEVK